MSLLEAKRKEIYQTLVQFNGNKTKAAEKLGMSLRSLRDLTNNDSFFHDFRVDNDLSSNKKEIRSMASEVQEYKSSEIFDTKEVVSTLHKLMNKVTDQECSAATVNAACNCASQITQLLRVHLDVERLKNRFPR